MLAKSATLETEQLVDGNDANNLTVQLNETNTSTVTVVSQNVQTDGQGLQLDFAQNFWNDRSDIDNAIRQLDAAKLKLRSASSSLSTNSNTLLTRLDFTAAFSDVLKEGAGKLTLADQNEEGANILTLQTRQQLGTISLSLANQAQQPSCGCSKPLGSDRVGRRRDPPPPASSQKVSEGSNWKIGRAIPDRV